MSRLNLTDSLLDVVTKMSDGNPGALNSIMEIVNKHDEIDPQAGLGWLGAIMMLDTWEIYGTDIYVLFNDKCDRNVRTFLMLMRATQLGLFPHKRLKEMSGDQRREVNITDEELTDLDKLVCEQLTEFKKPEVVA